MSNIGTLITVIEKITWPQENSAQHGLFYWCHMMEWRSFKVVHYDTIAHLYPFLSLIIESHICNNNNLK